jgi:hypothetical protein
MRTKDQFGLATPVLKQKIFQRKIYKILEERVKKIPVLS